MKKIYSLLLAVLLVAACNQKQNVAAVADATSLEGTCTIDIEKLNEHIDLDMDISQLSVSDLYILRHAFLARKGFPFRDAYLRSIYATTTWYDSLTWNFDGNDDYFKHLDYDKYYKDMNWRDSYYADIKDDVIVLSDEEQAFVDRVKAREDELLAQNFQAPEGYRVVVRNLLNARQMDSMPQSLSDQLARNGFAIVPTQHQQLFHVYEKNDYHLFPSFVTTDVFLQLFHLYFDATLREVEQQRFAPMLESFCLQAATAVASMNSHPASTTASPSSITAPAVHVGRDFIASGPSAPWLATYFRVAQALLKGQEPTADATALEEYRKVMKSEDALSEFLGYTNALYPYSLFRPRGHYTRNEQLGRYFRAMMWLQAAPLQTDRPADMQKAALLASVIGGNDALRQLYRQLTEPMTYLMGQPDDVSILQVYELMGQSTDMADLTRRVDQLAERQTRIRPKFQRTSRNKICLMPQRYQPDAEVLQEMVDYKSLPTTRPVPEGLDVMAAMGVASAEQILKEEQQKWKDFQPTLDRMKLRMDSIDWQETIAKQWLQALKTQTLPAPKAPYFMLTPQWQRKALNAALASWAELKHDAILYAKQPCGAECGGGGIPEPVLKGYVEPARDFWMKATELISNTQNLLHRASLLSDRGREISERIGELAMFLLNVSQKELDGTPLSDEENDQLQHIGATFENMSLDLLREGDQMLYEWSDVQGPERSVALIADVYTANADNNPEKSILYAGTGMADEIYVVVEMQGYLFLTRGAVFSYRELKRPLGEQRMNDEEWQQRLEKKPRLGVPQWMKPVTVPLQQAPQDNEEVFYSSGC